MPNIIKSLSKLISRCCVLLVLVTSGSLSAAEFDAKVVREIYDVKTAYGCAFSFSYAVLFVEELYKNGSTQLSTETLEKMKASLENHKNILKSFSSAEDKKAMTKAHQMMSTDKKYADTELHFKVINECERLFVQLTDETERRNTKNPTASSKVTADSLEARKAEFAKRAFAMRRSPWSSFDNFFNYKTPDLITEYRFNQHRMYFDKKSVEKQGAVRRVLTVTVHEPTAGSTVEVYELNCSDETYRFQGAIKMRGPVQKEDVYSVDLPSDTDWSYFKRETEVDALFKLLCN
jgi:hypothetical protein